MSVIIGPAAPVRRYRPTAERADAARELNRILGRARALVLDGLPYGEDREHARAALDEAEHLYRRAALRAGLITE